MKIAFQGEKGAFSHMLCTKAYPDADVMPCLTFHAAFDAVIEEHADLAAIPIDNTLAGRVADVHYLLPDSGLHIIAEHFLPISHNLMGIKGTKIEDITNVHSHVHALPQCSAYIKSKGFQAHINADTAGAARDVATMNDPRHAAIASEIAAEIYGLKILDKAIENNKGNKTRFIILSRDPVDITKGEAVKTALYFQVRNIPAALYKALSGFATNGINVTKLESYTDESFTAAKFYAEVEGHPDDEAMKHAMEELSFYTETVKRLGVFGLD
jgi:prephenate dehydratase